MHTTQYDKRILHGESNQMRGKLFLHGRPRMLTRDLFICSS